MVKAILVKYPDKLIDEVDNLVESGFYASRSDALRDAARILIRKGIGILDVDISSIELQKKIRQELWGDVLKKTKGNREKAVKEIMKKLKN